MLKPALNSVDTQFEALLQDLPLELVDSAREFRAFTHARKIKTPQELLRVIVDPEKWTSGLDRMPRSRPGDSRGEKDV